MTSELPERPQRTPAIRVQWLVHVPAAPWIATVSFREPRRPRWPSSRDALSRRRHGRTRLRGMRLTVEFDREEDGRWISDVSELPGVLVCGRTRKDARRTVDKE